MDSIAILEMLGGLWEELELQTECDHTHKVTEKFLREWYEGDLEEALEWIKNHGGRCCDCEIAMNIMGSEIGILAQLWDTIGRHPQKEVLIRKLFDLAEKDS